MFSRDTQQKKKPADPPYIYQEYPRALYKEGAPRHITVNSAEEEARMTEQGWGRQHIEPTVLKAPVTETEIALDRQYRANKVVMDQLIERHGEEMRQVRAELSKITQKYAQLEKASGESLIERSSLLEKNGNLEGQVQAMTGEIREANARADGLVEQLAAVTSELEAMKRHAAAAKAVQGAGANKKEKEN